MRHHIPAMLLGLAALAVVGAEAPDTPFSPTDWPRYMGPFDAGVTDPGGHELVDNLEDAALLWISEERNLGLGWGLGHGGSNKGRTTMRASGYAGPIVAEGRVFLQYYIPSGDVVFERSEKGRPIDVRKLRDPRPESWAIAADDVVLCADAETGRTLWKARLPRGTSFNWSRDETFQHPCVVNGTVYVQGTGGYAHALRAEDGLPVWTAGMGPGTRRWTAYRRKHLLSRTAIWGSQAFNVSPNYADGVVCFNDQTRQTGARANGLTALDAATGELLWAVEGVAGRLNSPVFWRHGGACYVIAVTSVLPGGGRSGGAISCFELKSGKLAWQLEGRFNGSMAPLVMGDRLLVSTQGVRGGPGSLYRKARERKKIDPEQVSYDEWLKMETGWRCFALHPAEPPRELWSLDLSHAGGMIPPIYHRDRVYMQTYRALICVDPATGGIIVSGPKVGHYVPIMATGDRIFQYGRMFDISDPEKIAEAGAIGKRDGFATIPYKHSCVSDGRLYVRGWLTDEALFHGEAPERGAIACFDLKLTSDAQAAD